MHNYQPTHPLCQLLEVNFLHFAALKLLNAARFLRTRAQGIALVLALLVSILALFQELVIPLIGAYFGIEGQI